MDISSGSSSSKSFGETGQREEDDLDVAVRDSRRIKTRALKSVMQSEVDRSHDLVCDDVVDIPVHVTSEVTSPLKVVPVSILCDGSFPPIRRCSSSILGGKDGRFTFSGDEISQNTKVDNDLAMECDIDYRRNTAESDECQMLESMDAPMHEFDLNAVDISNAVAHNEFRPHKLLEHAMSPESECGSSTSCFGENGSMKRWNDLKQNSFISNAYGGIPLPKAPLRKYQSKKRKEVEHRKNTELTKNDQLSRFSRSAAPTGLLSGLNPGIINHVRNRKQVRSIIESIVKSGKLDELCDPSDIESNDDNNATSDPQCGHNSDAIKHNPSVSRLSLGSDCIDETTWGPIFEEKTSRGGFESTRFTLECKDNPFSLKLPFAGVNVVENEGCRDNAGFSVNPETINALSLRGANIASQWLELLHQDFRGRYAALKRSRKRVRSVIQTELPHLFDLANREENPRMGQSTCTNESIESHAARWKSIFFHMEKTLNEEAKHLEKCLIQVRELQLHCDAGLKYAKTTETSVSGSSSLSRQRDDQTVEGQQAIMAAAASINSTCEFASSIENVHCF